MKKDSKQRFTAVIADDHEIVRAGLQSALERPGLVEEHGINVVGQAVNGLETIEKVKLHRPDPYLCTWLRFNMMNLRSSCIRKYRQ